MSEEWGCGRTSWNAPPVEKPKMSGNELDRLSSLERRGDELDELLRRAPGVIADTEKHYRDDLLLKFMLAAMQGDWAHDFGAEIETDDFLKGKSEAYLRAARAALTVWEARDGQA